MVLSLPYSGTLHQRIFPVHVVQDIGMDEGMIQRRVEDGLLVGRAAFHLHAAQVLLPGSIGLPPHALEGEALLLRIQVPAGIVDAHERDAHLHQHFLSGLEAVVVEPIADIVSAEFPGVVLINLVLAGIGIPGGFGGHGTLFFPITDGIRGLAYPQHEVQREHGVAVVAEGAHELESLDFRIAHLFNCGAALVGEALSQVQEDIALSTGEGIALYGTAGGGGGFGLDAAQQLYAVITGMRHLVLVFTAIDMVVHLQRPGGGHGEEGAQLRAAHAG